MDQSLVRDHASRIALRFMRAQDQANTYNNQLACEALLHLSAHIPSAEAHVAWVIDKSAITANCILPWQDQQFHDLAYAWFAYKGELHAYHQAYRQTTDAWIAQTARRHNGAIIHNCSHDPAGSLLDMLQAYCLRLARCANITNDERYITELREQLQLHHQELCDPDSGCYHQGKGWLAQDVLSPCCWSRGQGWLLHGLVHCLPLLRNWPDAHATLMHYTSTLLDALLALQGPSGLWHQLIDEMHDSFPDSSGSALILEAYLLYTNEMELQSCCRITKYDDCIAQAWRGLAACVDQDGVVDLACKGPGTIWEDKPWRQTHAPKGDPHGVFSMLFACAALLGKT